MTTLYDLIDDNNYDFDSLPEDFQYTPDTTEETTMKTQKHPAAIAILVIVGFLVVMATSVYELINPLIQKVINHKAAIDTIELVITKVADTIDNQAEAIKTTIEVVYTVKDVLVVFKAILEVLVTYPLIEKLIEKFKFNYYLLTN